MQERSSFQDNNARDERTAHPPSSSKGGIVYSVREPIFLCFTTPSMKHRLRLQLRAVLSSLVRVVGKNSIAMGGDSSASLEIECHRLVNKQTYT
ncbi:hypothetical protein CEXT_180731 [Caerostris extrusa]|uniref:Uncharacterized protein n=1 Tax=Caerostris extrusa TaxID=172846 RepID=A0AAV4MC32_CAEEX|nr:hypothetical protein CEXT_180731 [Caerostris extrusa]